MPKDPYSILGLDRSASLEDIKKAYRRLSKEYHPDKRKGDTSAEEKYKAINEAYEVLSNPKKRKMYDQFGSTDGNKGFEGMNFSGDFGGLGDLFENFFGSGFRSDGRAKNDRGRDLEVAIEIPFEDVVRGTSKSFSLNKMTQCSSCKGSAVREGSKMISCSVCSGTGQVRRTAQSFFGVIQQHGICEQCKGSGKIPESPCAKCSGDGRVNDSANVHIEIPPGIEDGQTLRIRGEGDAGRHGESPGDLFVHVRVHPDNRFERDKEDIRSMVLVPLLDAILGGDVMMKTVHGEVTLKVPPGTQSGQIFRLKGKGFPVLGSSRMGDHYAEAKIEIPKKISRAERKLLEGWRAIS